MNEDRKELASEIKELLNKGMKPKEIGEQTGASMSQIYYYSKVLSRERKFAAGKHIPKKIEKKVEEPRKKMSELPTEEQKAIREDKKQKKLEREQRFEGYKNEKNSLAEDCVLLMMQIEAFRRFKNSEN
jgi:hypothetical protein